MPGIALENQEWPFNEPKSTPVFTTKHVIYRKLRVLEVVHPDAGTWQFLDGYTVRREDGALVSLEYMMGLDPTLSQIADLPLGWKASREAAGFPWTREELHS